MVIVCPYCKKEYRFDKNKIPPNAKVMVRCKSCSNRFPLKRDQKGPEKSDAAVPETAMGRARKIAVILSKGGVGKTTTSVNLAVGLAMAGNKVLLVDTDTQGQASYMLGVKPKAGLTELATAELSPEEAVFQVNEKLSLLAGGKNLAGLKRLMSRKDFGGELTIAEALTPLEDQYDYIIFDCPPGWDVITVNVLFFVEEILIPVSLEAMTFQGLSEFLKNLGTIKKYREKLKVKYILPTFFDKRVKNSSIILNKLRDLYNKQLCTPIRVNSRISAAPMYGKTIYEYAPGSNGAADYRELIRKVTNDDKLFK
jgi:chromosome partitioning protein